MYRIWYWAVVGRESDGRFVASIPDLADLAAYGSNEKDAVANVAELAAEHVRSLLASGQLLPSQRPASEVPTFSKPNKNWPRHGSCSGRAGSCCADAPHSSLTVLQIQPSKPIYLVTILILFLLLTYCAQSLTEVRYGHRVRRDRLRNQVRWQRFDFLGPIKRCLDFRAPTFVEMLQRLDQVIPLSSTWRPSVAL